MSKYLFVIVAACLIGGCHQPDCASPEVQETILQIAKDHPDATYMFLIWGGGPLKNIRMTDKNAAGVLSCAASFDKIPSASINYKIEQTSDGRAFVTIISLR